MPVTHQVILAYLKVFVSWPFVLFVIVMIALYRFHEEISSLIRSGVEGKIGGTMIRFPGQTHQEAQSREELQARLEAALEESAVNRYIADTATQQLTTVQQSLAALAEFIAYEKIIRGTLRSQYWLLRTVQNGPVPRSTARLFFLVSSMSQRQTFEEYLRWLEVNQFIILTPDQVQIAQRGRVFLTYLGAMHYDDSVFAFL